jgi:glycosyltransferase involved in cell wall biosynthesis
VLLEAWPQVRAARPTAQLVVAGPASDVDCPPLPGVRYTGPVTPADVASLLATCRVAVLPSRHEAMPMFVLEAMSHGRPVVATAVGDVASVLNATSLVTPGDSGALAGALIEVLADPRQASVRGAANRAVVVDRFSPAAVRAQYASLYHDVLVARGRPVPDLLLGVDP